MEPLPRNEKKLLFPDFTFESWPEVHDYSISQTFESVWSAAIENGLPGTEKWANERDPRLLWRGSLHGKDRNEVINLKSPLLDIQAIGCNLTNKGMRLTSSNQISRSGHCRHRFILHMNGIFNNRYSSAIKWKLLCGSLVFLPSEPLFEEWWNYGVWKPYQHYVPFRNAEELLDRVQYYSQHLDEAAEIAEKGQHLAKSAFDNLDRFVDDTIRSYAEATAHLNSKPCFEERKNLRTDNEFKSLEMLQSDLGPTLCA